MIRTFRVLRLLVILLAIPVVTGCSRTFVVDNTGDDPALSACTDVNANDCSLRGAISTANTNEGPASDNINFDDTIFAEKQTIALTNGQLPAVIAPMAINGPTATGAGVTIAGDSTSDIFAVTAGSLGLNDLTVQGGVNGLVVLASPFGLNNAVSNCTFTGNTNGISVRDDGFIRVNNSTFSGNSGAGLLRTGTTSSNQTASVRYSTFTANGVGVGVDATNNNNTGPPLSIESSIIAGNTTNTIGNFSDDGSNILNVDARLGPLAPNGGPTFTHALLPGSPAIGTGDSSAVPDSDQRGVARPQGSRPDSGAFELEVTGQSGPNFVVTDTSDSPNGICAIDDCNLRAAINAANDLSDPETESSLPGTVSFAPDVRGTIALTRGELDISNDITIIGPGARELTISGIGETRLFRIGNNNAVISDLTLANGNSFLEQNNRGGAIRSDAGGSLTLRRCALQGNTGDQGGALYLGGGANVIDSCLFQGNSSRFNGGAIYNAATGEGGTSTLTVSNTTFAGNRGGNNGQAPGKGAAILTYATQGGNATTALDSCTFADNQGFNATLYTWNGENSGTVTTRLSNTILGDRIASFANEGVVTVTSLGHNLANDDGQLQLTAPTDILNTDPLLGELRNNIGPTDTFALLPGSPAIDAGDTALATDARGIARPFGEADDIGAFEFGVNFNPSLVVTTPEDEDDGTSDPDFGEGTSLREAINFANEDGVDSAITFDLTVFASHQTIALDGSELTLDSDGALSIAAPPAGVTISGQGASRVFVVNSTDEVTLTGLTIRDGNAGGGSGGGINNFGALTLNSCTLTGNRASSGGAIRSSTDDVELESDELLTLNNCTLSGNTATRVGGGLYNINGLSVVESCTITNNSAPDEAGGGVASFGDEFTLTQNSNSIIAGNGASDADSVFGEGDGIGGFQSNGFNLVGSGNATGEFVESGDRANVTDAGLAPLAPNGGPAQTIALVPGSPAIDSGQTDLAFDGRGLPRPARGADDIGAFEVNNAQPTVSPFSVTLLEDGSLAFATSDFASAFSDTEGETLTSIRIETLPATGALLFDGVPATVGQTIAAADIGKLTFVPVANLNGPTSFLYNAPDLFGFAAQPATVTLNVTPVNDVPSFALIANPNQTVLEDADSQLVQGFATQISAGPANESGQTLTFALSNDNASLFSTQPTINADGDLIYRPADNANGSATVTVTLKDDGGVLNGGVDTSAPQSFVINVTAVNDAPVAVADAYTTPDNTTLTVSAADGVLSNDGDIDSASLTAVLETNVSRGTLTLNADGSFTYVPEADETYTTAFSYRAFDGALSSESVNVTIGVNVTSKPIGFGVSILPKAPRTNDVLTATPVIADASGVSFSYEWKVNGRTKQTGPSNSFDLRVAGQGDKGDFVSVTATATRGIDTGTATNSVGVFNSTPVAFSQTGTAQGGVAKTFILRGADFDAEPLTFKRVGGPKSGTATIVPNADNTATLTYTALANFGGVEVIRFVAIDPSGKPSAPATLSIAVTAQTPPPPPNRAPSANNVTASTRPGALVAIPLSGSDPDGDPITFKRVGGPRNGTGEIRLDSDGVFKMFYTPRSNFVGNEVIRFVAIDPIGKPSPVATMTINVSNANNAPSAGGALKSAPSAEGA